MMLTSAIGPAFATCGCATRTAVNITGPDDASKATFDNANPGVKSFACSATATPSCPSPLCASPKITWSAQSISGTQISWDPNPPHSPTGVTLTLTTLPSSNSLFGSKWVSVSVDAVSHTHHYTLYFPEEALNNPGHITPNWFYYWKQTSANYGTVYYDVDSALGYTDYIGGAWKAFLGHEDNEGFTPPEGDNGGNLLDGIDNFAWTARHEGRHVTTNTSWYPNDYDPSFDGDNDGMPNAQEATLGGTQQNPIHGGPFTAGVWDTDGDTLPDVEDYTDNTQAAWTEGSADGSDWANPGHQY
jgi:hypothetical protein